MGSKIRNTTEYTRCPIVVIQFGWENPLFFAKDLCCFCHNGTIGNTIEDRILTTQVLEKDEFFKKFDFYNELTTASSIRENEERAAFIIPAGQPVALSGIGTMDDYPIGNISWKGKHNRSWAWPWALPANSPTESVELCISVVFHPSVRFNRVSPMPVFESTRRVCGAWRGSLHYIDDMWWEVHSPHYRGIWWDDSKFLCYNVSNISNHEFRWIPKTVLRACKIYLDFERFKGLALNYRATYGISEGTSQEIACLVLNQFLSDEEQRVIRKREKRRRRKDNKRNNSSSSTKTSPTLSGAWNTCYENAMGAKSTEQNTEVPMSMETKHCSKYQM